MSAIELTLPVVILGPPPIDLAVGADPKMVSGFLWGNPHEEDRERRLGKGSAVVLKELHYCGLFFPLPSKLQTVSQYVAHPNFVVQPTPHIVQAPRPRLYLDGCHHSKATDGQPS